jgi:hypothetical protein
LLIFALLANLEAKRARNGNKRKNMSLTIKGQPRPKDNQDVKIDVPYSICIYENKAFPKARKYLWTIFF